ncbi:hypothetical protein BJY04DRAFT_217481 [Aspergillus karnatakaensis]|uniref:uncharacterized protein n=1 Tax=Aspergillus karnatakaensis TaxID=1810916 RepID=UPI003CCD74C9
MASLTYVNEAGAGQKHSDLCHYSQAVLLPTDTRIVKCAGQGGWTNSGDLDASNVRGQVDLAFENVDRVLQAAGLKGWEDVYLVRSYHVDMDSSYDYVVEKLKTRIPEHRPVWTAIAVPRLAFPAMLIEIEVEAFDSRSGKQWTEINLSGPTNSQNTPPGLPGPGDVRENQSLQGTPQFSSQDLLVLQDIEMLFNSLGPNNEWYFPSEPTLLQFVAGDPDANASSKTSATVNRSNDGTLNATHMISKLPTERETVAEFGVLTLPILTVTPHDRERLVEALTVCHSSTSRILPSCQSLSRFLNGFFDGFYPHMPMVHIPTFAVVDCEPEILLAMCTLGAELRHENRKAILLFYAARDILFHRTRGRDCVAMQQPSYSGTAAAANGNGELPHQQTPTPTPRPIQETSQYCQTMREARCAFLLIAFAAWQCNEPIAREGFNLQSFLARCVREFGLHEGPRPCAPSNNLSTSASTSDWRAWVQEETDRRVKLFAFAFLNLQSVAFGTPPLILADEITLRLPCSCLEWIAPNEQKWRLIHRSGHHREQMLFQDALCHVMKSSRDSNPTSIDENTQPVPSPQANYILIHAIIQRILLVSRTLGPCTNETNNVLLNGLKDTMGSALHAWTSHWWQRAPESSLDPRNPNGPVTFTSTALLGVAYIRLCSSFGSATAEAMIPLLESRNAQGIADRLQRLLHSPRPEPKVTNPHLLPAVLHATHALSIPVKLGVTFVARSHAYAWGIQHSLCGMEFAVFLSQWLFCLASCSPSSESSQSRYWSPTARPLNDHEARLVDWIADIVEEGRTSGDDDFWPRPSRPSDCIYLGCAVVRLWARLIRGNDQWALLRVVGDALDIYAATCEGSFLSGA